jgi:hypothetical protein
MVINPKCACSFFYSMGFDELCPQGESSIEFEGIGGQAGTDRTLIKAGISRGIL